MAHIEGGEVSGTIDELIRHSISKMSHLHYVSNTDAQKRLIQMGEMESSIRVIGSPDVDIMFSKNLPSIEEVKKYYEIPYKNYGIVMFHSVTTEYKKMKEYIENLVNALLEDSRYYVVIYPNNDLGSKFILNEYKRLENNLRFRIIPSLRFEYFLILLKNSKFIIGNSSTGIREAPYYGIPTLNVGTRQENRALHSHIVNITYDKGEILAAINSEFPKFNNDKKAFGKGNSSQLFVSSLAEDTLWNLNHQKQFIDIKS